MKVINELFNEKINSVEYLEQKMGKKKKKLFVSLLKSLNSNLNSINNGDLIDESIIENFFSFLECNINYDDKEEIKDVIYNLINIESNLIKKKTIIQKLNNNSNNLNIKINYVLNRITDCENYISEKKGYSFKELLNDIYINKILYVVFEKRDIKKSIKIITENPTIFDYYDKNGKNFITIIFEKYKELILEDKENKEEISYYVELIRYTVKNENAIDCKKNLSCKVAQLSLLDNNFSKVSIIDSYSNIDLKLFNSKYNKKEDRFQFINDYKLSIDHDNTSIYDDALSIEKTKKGTFLLSIHIADVISLGLDRRNILGGIINNTISKKDGSLKSFEPQNAITLLVEISKDGEVLDYKIVKSKISVNCNMDNSVFKNYLKDQNINYAYYETIRNLCELYGVLKNSKMLDNPSDDEMGLKIVEKTMVLCGSIISDYFNKNNLPFMYVNSTPGNSIYYSTENKGYNTGFEDLGLNSYGKCTSPIYDDPSLISQLLIYDLVFKKYTDYDIRYYDDKLLKLSKDLNVKNDYKDK